MNNLKQFELSTLSRACIVALGLCSVNVFAEESEIEVKNTKTEIKDKIKQEKTDEVERIEVTGIRGSLRESLNNKRFASEIMDSISAEDIGQLPDENIAEAIQRITGVSMTRSDDGEGESLQIRGESSNNVEINGQTLTGTNGDSRGVNFQDLPSELFAGVDIQKASTADRIEGSLGGTVNLKTRKPLGIQKDSLTSVTAKAKYNDLSEEVSPEFSVFTAHNFRDTKYGDFGFLVTVSDKEVETVTEAFGAGTYGGAPSRWSIFTGATAPAGDWKPGGDHPYDANIDVNGDGVSDENDIFYAPNGWNIQNNYKHSKRNSINLTLQWQPNDKTNFWIDGTYAKVEDTAQNSTFQISTSAYSWQNSLNGARQGLPLEGGNNVYEHLRSTDEGDFYALTAGRLGGMNVRMGSAPSASYSERDSHQFVFGGEYEINDEFRVKAEYATSAANKDLDHAQLNLGHDQNGDGKFTGADYRAVVDFNEAGVDLADITYYQPPTFNDGLLEAIDPTDFNNPSLALFQSQNTAASTENSADSLKIDFEYDLLEGPITQVKFGYRRSERSFYNESWQGKSQKNDRFVNGIPVAVNLQDIYANPDSNTNPENAALAEQIMACYGTSDGALDGFSGNIPTTFVSTSCDVQFWNNLFGFPDIRAVDDESGLAYYQRNGNFTKAAGRAFNTTNVTETTNAAYFRADFFMPWFKSGVDFYGNVGVRYVKTDLEGLGAHIAPADAETAIVYGKTKGSYQDWLPSLNMNWALRDDLILRSSWTKTMARAGLGAVAPRLNLNYNDRNEGYAGSGNSGNPNLKPRQAESVDLSLEWYFSEDALLSGAVYYKELMDLSATSQGEDLLVGEELFFVTQPINIGHTRLKGWEVSYQQAFTFLPSVLKHTGFSANYTRPKESATQVDGHGDPRNKGSYSEDTYNITLWYDDNKLSARFAYNYRSEYVRSASPTLGWGRWNDPYRLPQMVDARGQLDFSMNYKWNDNLKINLSIVNLNDTHTEYYLKYKQLTDRISYSGRRANLGVVYKF